MFSILTFVPNLDKEKTCCLGCSCGDYDTFVNAPMLDPEIYCKNNFTEGVMGTCWSSCYDGVYCSFGEKDHEGNCPQGIRVETTTTTTTTTTATITTTTKSPGTTFKANMPAVFLLTLLLIGLNK